MDISFISFFILGLFLLVKGGSLLINGASSLAVVLKINPAVIGITVVAFGTTLPEFIISLTSSLSGHTNIILGNILGSNIANILLILGVSAFILPLKIQRNIALKIIPLLLLTSSLFALLAVNFDSWSISNLSGDINWLDGIILLSIFTSLFLYLTRSSVLDTSYTPLQNNKHVLMYLSLIGLGILGLIIGSKLLVDNGILLAKVFGVSDTLIGLTFIAIGTSLPELTTSVLAAIKKEPSIAVGNIIGSNVFNLFFILGMSSLINPIVIPSENYIDILIVLLTTALLFVCTFVIRRYVLSRLEGIILLLFYFVYISFIFWRG